MGGIHQLRILVFQPPVFQRTQQIVGIDADFLPGAPGVDTQVEVHVELPLCPLRAVPGVPHKAQQLARLHSVSFRYVRVGVQVGVVVVDALGRCDADPPAAQLQPAGSLTVK